MAGADKTTSASYRRSVPRPRASYSCHACRARRVKCDREHPQCSRCLKDEVTCTYPESSKDQKARRKTSPRSRSEKEKGLASRKPPIAVASRSTSSGSTHERKAVDPANETVPGLGYLSLRRGGRSRYVGRTFWAFVDENNKDLDTLLHDQARASSSEQGGRPFLSICPTCQHVTGSDKLSSETEAQESQLQSALRPPLQGDFSKSLRQQGAGPYATALPGLLECLPSRAACDMLYKNFVTSIHSILPLLHLPTFDELYRRFWLWIEDRNGQGSAKGILTENPSFLPLLFSVLFGGAVSCSTEELKSQFGLTPRASITSVLCQAAMRTQNMVGFPRSPTIYSLTSFLIVQNLLVRDEEPLAACSYISVALRVAQAMGFHRDGTHFGLDPVEAELRRRIWWHIIHTDIMTSIPSALPPSCLSDSIYDTKMLGVMKDTRIAEAATAYEALLDRSDQPSAEQKIYPKIIDPAFFDLRLMVAVDRYAITSVLRLILRRQFDTTPLKRADIVNLRGEVEALESRITSRIEQLHDILRRQSAVQSTDHSHDSHEDDFDKPVFVKWAILLMQLMVHRTYSVLYQPLTRQTEHSMWAEVRSDCIGHCQKFIEIYYEICTSKSFRPYHWLYPGLYQPLHAAVVLLSDLLRVPQSPQAERSMYLIDQLFSLSTPSSGIISEDDGILTVRNLSEAGKEAWTLLRRLRKQAWEKAGRDPDLLWTGRSPPGIAISALISDDATTKTSPFSTDLRTPESSGGISANIDASLKTGLEYTDPLSQPLENLNSLMGSDLMQFDWIDWDSAMIGPPEITTPT